MGGFAGHEVGHNGVATILGAVAGAYGGHKLEGKHEEKKEEKRRRAKEGRGPRHEVGPYADGGRRQSRGIGGEREYDDESSESEYEDRPRRHHH